MSSIKYEKCIKVLTSCIDLSQLDIAVNYVNLALSGKDRLPLHQAFSIVACEAVMRYKLTCSETHK